MIYQYRAIGLLWRPVALYFLKKRTMQRLFGFLSAAIILAFTACKGHEKKVLVYASSNIQIDNTKKHITVGDGTTHHEQELDFTGGDPVTIETPSPLGNVSLTVPEDGLYIANLKNDTV